MVTKLTALTSKDVAFLQPHKSAKWCERQLSAAKKAVGASTALLGHLADFWAADVDDLINMLRPRFVV